MQVGTRLLKLSRRSKKSRPQGAAEVDEQAGGLIYGTDMRLNIATPTPGNLVKLNRAGPRCTNQVQMRNS